MKNSNVKFITRTAILLALTIVFQAMGRYIPLGPNSNFVVGPLVNASLLIATAFVGIIGGGIIAIVSPFAAILTGAAVPLPFVPFVGVGNFLLVLGFYILMKRNQIAGMILGSAMKFGFLNGAIVVFLNLVQQPAKKHAALMLAFSWPQIVTALMGSAIAFVVIKALEKHIEK